MRFAVFVLKTYCRSPSPSLFEPIPDDAQGVVNAYVLQDDISPVDRRARGGLGRRLPLRPGSSVPSGRLGITPALSLDCICLASVLLYCRYSLALVTSASLPPQVHLSQHQVHHKQGLASVSKSQVDAPVLTYMLGTSLNETHPGLRLLDEEIEEGNRGGVCFR